MPRWLIGLALGLYIAEPALAVVFTVTTTTDAVDVTPGDGICAAAGGECTLRAAIQEANALAGDDVISVPAATYTLSITGAGEDAGATGDLDVASADDLEIHGGGAFSTIVNAAGLDRAFDTKPAGTVTMTDLSIINGQASSGGGINNTTTLTLEQVMIRSNTATGLGGGINTTTQVFVTDSTISGNRALNGGGIAIGGFLNFAPLTNSTFSGNDATRSGGAIYSYVLGAASLHNATIAGNIADSDDDGDGDGGGAADEGEQTIFTDNSIVAGNTDLGGELPDLAVMTVFGVNNLIGGDPLLGHLQYNGGPTLTRAPLPGSPAVDAGNPAPPGSGGSACEGTDQRGVTRPIGAACDIGAFEGTVVGNPLLDHFKCYQGKDLKNPNFTKRTAATTDQLADETVAVQKVKFVCTAVDKNGEGISNPSAHLACYQIKGNNLDPQPEVQLSTQFQTSQFALKKPKLLCVPSTITLLP